jgi:hypothetical protein
MTRTDEPKLETDYDRDEVSDFYEHDATGLSWVLTKDGQIQALRIRQDYNQNILNARAEVWVGDDSPTKEWGIVLGKKTKRTPVFLKKSDASKYTYMGVYEVLPDEANLEQLTHAREKVPHDRGVSRVVFLKKS